jgi:hypothetical protein
MEVNAIGEYTGSERAEAHFLPPWLDELMRKMLAAGVSSQAELNESRAEASGRHATGLVTGAAHT